MTEGNAKFALAGFAEIRVARNHGMLNDAHQISCGYANLEYRWPRVFHFR